MGMISNINLLIRDMAKIFGIKAEIVYGIIKQESDFDMLAVRYEPAKGECSYGLMQVMCSYPNYEELKPVATDLRIEINCMFLS